MTFFGVKNLEILELSANLLENLEGFKFNIFQRYVNRISFKKKETVSFFKNYSGFKSFLTALTDKQYVTLSHN